jgi:hypothetical protein
MYIKIFLQNVAEDILELFESTHITINFRDHKIRVSFQEFEELIHFLHHNFSVLFLKQELYFSFTTRSYLIAIF